MLTLTNKRLFKKLVNFIEWTGPIMVMVILFITFSNVHKNRKSSVDTELISFTTSTHVPDTLHKELDSLAIELIKESEGFSRNWYSCPGGQRTIGYGFTSLKWNKTMTLKEADSIVIIKYNEVKSRVSKLITNAPLEDHQLAAVTSFAYNVGISAFEKSKLLKYLNSGLPSKVEDEFIKWIYAKSRNGKKRKLDGLVKRRNKELRLWKMELS